MIRSMTAYGRALSSSSLGKWVVEIHSVNKKGLDFNLFMSREFLQFDLEIRKWLSAHIRRGQVTVKVFFQPEGSSLGLFRLQSLKQEMEKMALELDFPLDQITFPFLYEEAKAVPKNLEREESQILVDLKDVMEKALDHFVKMREEEGKALKIAFETHLDVLQTLLLEVESRIVGIEERCRKKILEKLQEFKEVFQEDKDRVLREVFFYTEKSDVTEEIVRLKSHIQQFRGFLSSEEKSIGKSMDFLIQEMGREINTLASKSDDLEISTRTLKMKSELEKIREQAQNVE